MKHIELNCDSLAEAYARAIELINVTDLGHKTRAVIDIDTSSKPDWSWVKFPDYTKGDEKRKVEKAITCKWFRSGDECGKGLPGTPCEVVGCVAWEHYKKEQR